MKRGEKVQLIEGESTVLERLDHDEPVYRITHNPDNEVTLIQREMEAIICEVANDLDGITVVEH